MPSTISFGLQHDLHFFTMFIVAAVLQALGYAVAVYVKQDNSCQTKRALLDTAESLR